MIQRCWQFDLCFLFLFKTQFGHLEVLVHIMLKSSVQDSMHDLTSMEDECSCPMVSTFLSTTVLGN